MISTQSNILPAPKILQQDVECFRVVEFSGDEGVAIKVAPGAAPGIVFQHENGRSALESIIMDSEMKATLPTAFVCAAGTEPSVMNFKKGSYVTIQVVLKPHALHSLFGLNALSLNQGYAELNEFAEDDLNLRLMEANSPQEQVNLLSRFLVTKLEQAKSRDGLIEEGLRLIHSDIACVSVKELLTRLSISERHFERRFSQTVGVSAQSYIRVKRVNEAIRLIKSGHYKRLTDIAYALNFYDQSHFIREISAFSGMTPKSMSRKVDDSYHHQAGYSYV